MSCSSRKNKNVKGIDKGYVTLVSVLYSHNCGGKIHSAVERLRKDHGLRWIQVRMSYHQFPNKGGNYMVIW